MDTFGRIFRVTIIGESHGRAVSALISGCPPGVRLDGSDFEPAIKRRKSGAAGTTGRTESDRPIITSGVFRGYTTGAPVLVEFENSDAASDDYEQQRYLRPGHADLVAKEKYGDSNDYRGGGRFSGRLTLPLVAAGVLAAKLLPGMQIAARLVEAGGKNNIEESLDEALQTGDSIGGIVECTISGLRMGLGEPFFDSMESILSHLIFSIPGVKGIEFGTGFESARMKGSQMNDAFVDASGQTATNNSGGINGGITNGNDIVFRVAFRPTPSIALEQNYINVKSGELERAVLKGRHDVCFALRTPPVVEACAAIALADMTMLQNSRG